MLSFIKEFFGLLFLNSVFFYAGLKKLFAIMPTAESISGLPIFSSLPWVFSLAATVATIVIEIFAPIIVMIGFLIPGLGNIYEYGLYSLIGFTILASLFYHPITDPSQRTSFFKNLGLIGGFIIALDLVE